MNITAKGIFDELCKKHKIDSKDFTNKSKLERAIRTGEKELEEYVNDNKESIFWGIYFGATLHDEKEIKKKRKETKNNPKNRCGCGKLKGVASERCLKCHYEYMAGIASFR